MKRLIITLAAVAFAISAVRAAERPAGPPGGRPRGEMPLLGPRLMDELALTDDQKPKVQALETEFDGKRDAIRAEQKKDPAIQKLHEDMKAARDAGDKAKMAELRPKIAEYAKPLLDLRKQYMDKVRALLTPDQITKLDAAKERLQEHRGKKGGAAPPPAN